MASDTPHPPSEDTAPEADPGQLARLVLRLRDFRAEVDGARAGVPATKDRPFLHRQLEEQCDALKDALDELVAEAKGLQAKKPGLLGRMFGRSKKREQRHADLEGNSWTIPVTELVGFLSNARKTGMLWVDAESEQFVIEIKDGQLIRAIGNATPSGQRLGELLAECGALEKHEVPDVVLAARTAGRSLGSYLIEEDRVSESDVKHALSLQVQALFDRLLHVDSAVYRFQEGVDIEDAKELELNVTHLLLQSARVADEASRGGGLAILEEPLEAADEAAEDDDCASEDADDDGEREEAA